MWLIIIDVTIHTCTCTCNWFKTSIYLLMIALVGGSMHVSAPTRTCTCTCTHACTYICTCTCT